MQAVKCKSEESEKGKELKNIINCYHELVKLVSPDKKLPNLDLMGLPPQIPASHPLGTY